MEKFETLSEILDSVKDEKEEVKDQVTISYKTLDSINKEMSERIFCSRELQNKEFTIKNNELDLRKLGALIKLRLPKEVLLSEEQIKVTFLLNVSFGKILDYQNFFQTGCILPISFRTINYPLKTSDLNDISEVIFQNNGMLFYKDDSKNYNKEFRQLGKVNCLRYNEKEGVVYVELLVSKEITGTSYLFSSQNDIVNKCTNAIRRDNDEIFLELFPHLIDKKMKNEDGNTLEYLAAWYGKVNLLKHIREYVRLDPNVSLSGARHSKVLEYLESVGDFYPFYKDLDGFNPLQQACNIAVPGSFLPDVIEEEAILDRIKSIDIILNKGVDINIKNNFGRTPLMCASNSSREFPIIVKHLLSKGADVNIVCNDGKKALDYTRSDEVTELLLKNMDVFINFASVIHDFREISKIINDEGLSSEDLKEIETVINNLESLSYFDMLRKAHTIIDEEFVNELKKILDFYNKNKKLSQYNFNYFNKIISNIENLDGIMRLRDDYPLKIVKIN